MEIMVGAFLHSLGTLLYKPVWRAINTMVLALVDISISGITPCNSTSPLYGRQQLSSCVLRV